MILDITVMELGIIDILTVIIIIMINITVMALGIIMQVIVMLHIIAMELGMQEIIQ